MGFEIINLPNGLENAVGAYIFGPKISHAGNWFLLIYVPIMKRPFQFLTIALGLTLTISLSSCGRYNFIKEVSKEDKQSRPRIYGDVDGPALQSKNTYPTNPDAAKNAAVLKAQLFGEEPKAADVVMAPVAVDTAKAVESSKEN